MVTIWIADWVFSHKVGKIELPHIVKDVVTPKLPLDVLFNDPIYKNRALRGMISSKKDSYVIKDIIFNKKLG